MRWKSSRSHSTFTNGKLLIHLPEDFPLMVYPLSFIHGSHNTPNYHDCLEICYVEKGTGTFHIGEKTYPVQPGDVFVIGNTELHVLRINYHNLLRVVNLYFLPSMIHFPGANMVDFQYLQPFYDHSVEFSHRIPTGSAVNAEILALFGRICREMTERGSHYQIAAKSLLCEILLLLVRFYDQFAIDHSESENRMERLQRLKKVFSCMQEHYQEKISLEKLSTIACMSPSYLCKFFKQTTGCTLKEYLHRIRIDKAQELLIIRKFSITQVGLEVGFDNHGYFCRVFRKINGISPKEFCQKLSVKDIA
jgi:AraC-like DNA-binding protein/quercetin dioxygenase-like cupin family protein